MESLRTCYEAEVRLGSTAPTGLLENPPSITLNLCASAPSLGTDSHIKERLFPLVCAACVADPRPRMGGRCLLVCQPVLRASSS